ncbi:MAG: hypothetical protein VB048_10040 [Bacteroidaceae bacterium]|nr:hypothetical protein [Bacteroidaceae bacterium]
MYAIGLVKDGVISITSSITLSCKSYAYSYYGKDSSSGLKSKTLKNCGHKYVVNDGNHKEFNNKVYYDGLVYKNNSYRLSEKIVNNLYGVDYEVE